MDTNDMNVRTDISNYRDSDAVVGIVAAPKDF